MYLRWNTACLLALISASLAARVSSPVATTRTSVSIVKSRSSSASTTVRRSYSSSSSTVESSRKSSTAVIKRSSSSTKSTATALSRKSTSTASARKSTSTAKSHRSSSTARSSKSSSTATSRKSTSAAAPSNPSAAASQIPRYFKVAINSLLNYGYGYDQIDFTFFDPATPDTYGYCFTTFEHQKVDSVQGQPPSDWVMCHEYEDPAFSFRVDSYVSDTEFRLGLRHQYTGNGTLCSDASAPDCITRLGYVDFNTTVPGYSLYDTGDSSSAMASGQMQAQSDAYDALVYSHCTGCATNPIRGSYWELA